MHHINEPNVKKTLIISVFLISLALPAMAAENCSIKQDSMCLYQHIENLYTQIQNSEEEIHIPPPNIMRFAALNGFQDFFGYESYYNKEGSYIEPLSLYRIYKLFNEKQYIKIIDFIKNSKLEDHVSPYRSDHFHASDISKLCNAISALFFSINRADLISNLRDTQICGESMYIKGQVLGFESSLYLLHGKYKKSLKTYNQCNKEEICHVTLTEKNLWCANSIAKTLSNSQKEHLNEYIEKLSNYKQTSNIKYVSSGRWIEVLLKSLFLRLSSSQDIERKLLSDNKAVYGYEFADLRRAFYKRHIMSDDKSFSDDARAELIKRIDQYQIDNKTKAMPIQLNALAFSLHKEGYNNASIAALDAKTNNPRYQMIKDNYLLTYLHKEITATGGISDFYRHIDGVHNQCLISDHARQCLERKLFFLFAKPMAFDYLKCPFVKLNIGSEYRIKCRTIESYAPLKSVKNQIDTIKMQIDREAFLEAIESARFIYFQYLYHKYFVSLFLRQDNNYYISKNINWLRGIENNLDLTNYVANLNDGTFKNNKCLEFLEQNTNMLPQFEIQSKDPVSRLSALIYAKCLASLSDDNLRNHLISHEEYQSPTIGRISTLLFGYNMMKENQIKIIIDYPVLSASYPERIKEAIRSGEKIQNTKSAYFFKRSKLQKKWYEAMTLLQENIKTNTPILPDQRIFCATGEK